MKNIHIIPTNKPSKLYKVKEQFYIEEYPVTTVNAENQNIYITNDEEIEEGDWFIYNNNLLKKTYKLFYVQFANFKKIILTTDPKLIVDGVQAIDDEFLEWFVKNPSCEEVEVGYGWIRLTETDNEGYWVSIPNKQFEMQQEEPKQETVGKQFYETADMVISVIRNKETLEEAAKRYCLINNIPIDQMIVKNDRSCEFKTPITMFIEGAKWQEQRMYSEEEVKQIIDTTLIEYSDFVLADIPHWFEQFKKK